MEKERIEHQAIGGKEGLEQGLEDKEGKEDKEDEGKETALAAEKRRAESRAAWKRQSLCRGKSLRPRRF